MKMPTESEVENYLRLDFAEDNTIWLTNSYTLRKTIGILGMALPFLLFFFLWIDNGLTMPLESISHYYYTRVSGIFVAIMSMLAIFLIIYKGKDPIDFIISGTAGIAALLVVFFPTGNISEICCDTTKTYSVTKLFANPMREDFHYFSAALFLGCLAFMSIFLFTKSNKPVRERGSMKILRNRIYRVCGVLMVLSMAVILLGGFFELIPPDIYASKQITYWMETVAVESFGFSWLVKGESIFKDRG